MRNGTWSRSGSDPRQVFILSPETEDTSAFRLGDNSRTPRGYRLFQMTVAAVGINGFAAADHVVIRDRSQACSNSFAKLSSCLATAWITVCGKIVKTSFGTVDGQAFEKLQDSFDTTELLRAVDAIDRVNLPR
jgi:hypothetical protein